jgi:hypothetical protein
MIQFHLLNVLEHKIHVIVIVFQLRNFYIYFQFLLKHSNQYQVDIQSDQIKIIVNKS